MPTTATPKHPGDLIAKLLDDRGLTVRQVADHAGIGERHLLAAIERDGPLTPEQAVRLELGFALNAETLLQLQASADAARLRARAQAGGFHVEPYGPA